MVRGGKQEWNTNIRMVCKLWAGERERGKLDGMEAG